MGVPHDQLRIKLSQIVESLTFLWYNIDTGFSGSVHDTGSKRRKCHADFD